MIIQAVNKSIVACFVLLLLSPSYLVGQNTEKLPLKGNNASQRISIPSNVRALLIRGSEEVLNNIFIEAGNDLIIPGMDEHYDPLNGLYHSNLVVLDQPLHSIIIKGLAEGNSAELILIHWSNNTESFSNIKLRADCDKPEMISQQVWRAGLPEPEYDRVWNQVRNIILHHSATSNSLTDYTAIVRSIYIYHTQVNQWSDMGYNYLIAPDGTIFSGRDPGNLVHDDEVMGAHFCASNSGTLGICLIGTYTAVEPTSFAMESLNKLLAWKTAKDSLSPFAINQHALNPQLGVIAAHRHGCETICPGEGIMTLLHDIKHDCNAALEECGIFLDLSEYAPANLLRLYPNPSADGCFQIKLGSIDLSEIYITDLNGQQLAFQKEKIDNSNYMITLDKPNGVYILVVLTETASYSRKLIILN